MTYAGLQWIDKLITRYPALESVQPSIQASADAICRCHHAGGQVLICGNGGSAADSDHIVGELMKSFVLPRAIPSSDRNRLRDSGIADWQSIADSLQSGVRAISLSGHPALSTAIQNDTDAAMVFAQQVYVYGTTTSVLMAFSTSGNSRNVVQALKVAKAKGMTTLGFSGARPGNMDDFCDIMIKVPATETYAIQEYHLPVYHAICLSVEAKLFG